MDPILSLAKTHSFYVIEDCAQAHGAIYKGKPVGSIGDIGCWSFCQDKIMTTGGEGGMVTTNNAKLWSSMWSYKDHGKSWDAVYSKNHPDGFRWLHESFGTNWRMTEMQAAIGLLQIKKMPDWIEKRSKNAQQILAAAKKCEVLRVPNLSCKFCDQKPLNCNLCKHAYYKCYVFVNGGCDLRNRYMKELNKLGVPCFRCLP